MPQMSAANELTQHCKRLHEETLHQLREEARLHKQCAKAHALLQEQHLSAMQAQEQLQQEMQSFRKQLHESRVECEHLLRLLCEEIHTCESERDQARQDIATMQFSKHLLVDEIKDLRCRLKEPSQKRLVPSPHPNEANTHFSGRDSRNTIFIALYFCVYIYINF